MTVYLYVYVLALCISASQAVHETAIFHLLNSVFVFIGWWVESLPVSLVAFLIFEVLDVNYISSIMNNKPRVPLHKVCIVFSLFTYKILDYKSEIKVLVF